MATVTGDGEELDEGGGGQGMAAFKHISEAFLAAASQQPCILVLDGIDELGSSCGLSAQQVSQGSLHGHLAYTGCASSSKDKLS